MSREMSYREGIAWTAHELGLLALRRADRDAERLLREALAGHRALGDRWRTAGVLADLAASAVARDDHAAAVALLGAAAAVRAEIGTDLAPCERPDHDRVDVAARARLAPDEFARAWAHGQTASLDDLLAEAAAPRPASDVALGRLPVPAAPVATLTEPAGRLRIAALGDHTALRDLRRALGDAGWVTFSAGRYTLDRTRDHWCDLEIFEEAVAAARQARPSAAALPHLQRAIDAYRGEFGAGLPEAEWLQPRRAELAQAFAQALAATGRLLLAAGRPAQAVEVYRRAVQHDPLDESAHRQLMTALLHTGEAGQAAQVYRRLEQRLQDELGVPPAAETRAVYRQLGCVK